ncbi:CpsB/CapC family capsule biosynthesis tyrosine phosphatase [Hydrogenimonas sp. SS33]|uniref:tyrosine-protein phosphatase n=1 Tax=Hydrogenimonas leucolamina TaxID=2954236 RepID=UPI00336C006C
MSHHLRVDIHSHLIPGIDDGSKTMFESVKYVRMMKDLGYEKLITTPHIMSHRYKNSKEEILEKLEYLKDALQDYEVDMELEAAAEYYLDDYFLELLEKGDMLTFGDRYLLFEMSYTRAPNDLTDIVLEIERGGYKPVLAHPERYLFMHNDFEEYERLKDYGVYFQLNLNSLAGYYNRSVQKTAHKLVEEGLIDFLGSDVHKERQIETLKSILDSKEFQTIFKKNTILNNTLLPA